MSFDYNPYNHIELIKFPPRNPDTEPEIAIVHCHGCGWDSDAFSIVTSAFFFFQIAGEHIRKSHNRSEDDFEGWSDY